MYHFVLSYSKWETGTIGYSESFESLSEGWQNALWDLGGVPNEHRSDRMSGAVNNLVDKKERKTAMTATMKRATTISQTIHFVLGRLGFCNRMRKLFKSVAAGRPNTLLDS
jgi:hypothetical protein